MNDKAVTGTQRLSLATLDRLPAAIVRPAFDPGALGTGILHLGIGAFHRGHMAHFTQDAIERAAGSWGIAGVSLRSPDMRDRLMPQDGLYTVLERGQAGERAIVIGTVRDVIFAPERGDDVVRRMADPAIRIVSLTVTEKGYCHDPATGQLREIDADIVHDLTQPTMPPRSAIGVLVRGLDARRRAGGGGITLLSCDNLPSNGRTLGGLVRRFAQIAAPDLVAWIDDNVTFPSAMVDRIVPATTDADRAAVGRLLGVEDAGPVMVEPFRQWVIEDKFAAGRPAWDLVGAELVADVTPFEEMKLRLLNGSHSTMAYLGFLAGHTFIYEVIADAAFRRLVERLMEEAAATLHLPSGVDVGAYRAALIERFANPALGHRCRQIAMDGSQKLPQRMLGTIRDRRRAGAPIDALALGVAGWLRYLRGVDETGAPYEIADPMAAMLTALAGQGGDAAAQVDRLLAVAAVFGPDLKSDAVFRDRLTHWLGALDRDGAARTVASLG